MNLYVQKQIFAHISTSSFSVRIFGFMGKIKYCFVEERH